jgi:hypothetical protein
MMETVIFTLSAIAGLAAGLALGGLFWGHHSDTVKAQAEEIDALNLNNLRLRGQAAELATMAHEAQADAHASKGAEEMTERLMQQAESMLASEIDAHRATKRRLSAAKGQITKLKRRMV